MINVTGLLRAETARVWIFLLPFVAVPAALELAKRRPGSASLFVALLWTVALAMKSNLCLIEP